MVAEPDLSVLGRFKTVADFDREAEDFAFKKALQRAEIAKAQRMDIDALGEQAFFKAAQGLELTPQERAAAQFVDAKSGGISYNPVTGESIQKPRLSDKIGIYFPENAPPSQPQGMVISESGAFGGNLNMKNPPAPPFGISEKGGMGEMLPRGTMAQPGEFADVMPIDEGMINQPAPKIGENEGAAKELMQTQPYFQTPKGQAEASRLLLEARMKDIESQKSKSKPMPASILSLENKIISEASGAGNVINTTQKYINMIDTGGLDLGLFSNLGSQVRNFAGKSTETSRNFNSFKTDLEKMRNDSLRLNAGVQTDGDAQRAWNELVANINDPGVVRQRLEEINGYNQTALAIKQGQLEDLRNQYGKEPLDVGNAQGSGGYRVDSNSPKKLNKLQESEAVFNAKKAIKNGARAEDVKQRLIDNGIDPTKAGL